MGGYARANGRRAFYGVGQTEAAFKQLAVAVENIPDAERRRLYGALHEQLSAHDKLFDQLAQLTAVEVAERTKLFAGGDQLTVATNAMVAATQGLERGANALGVEASILAVRVANWRFLATHDAGGPAVFAANVQTAKATDEISSQIVQIQASTKDAVETIRGIVGVIEEVSAIATAIASAVEQQGAATAEIARSAQQTASSTHDVTHNISSVSQAANDTGAAASQVLGSATSLSRQAEQLSSEVNSFVAGVRAA